LHIKIYIRKLKVEGIIAKNETYASLTVPTIHKMDVYPYPYSIYHVHFHSIETNKLHINNRNKVFDN
jgi:hypothetical protein